MKPRDVMLAVAISLPVLALPLFAMWISAFLKDSRIYVYAMSFVLFLTISLVALERYSSHRRSLPVSTLRGVFAGYVAGLAAYMVMALGSPDGAERLANSMEALPSGFAAVFLLSPIFTGLFLYGGAVGAGVELFRRRAERSGE